MNEIYAWIDEHQQEFIQELQTFLRQPSISAQKVGLGECADMTVKIMKKAGIQDADLYPTVDGPEIAFGSMRGATNKTLLCYAHYDVQPPGSDDLWKFQPFGAQIDNGIIYARGATDNKSGLLAFVYAAQAFRDVWGKPPVNLKFLFEGEEEVGSPHLGDWVEKNLDLVMEYLPGKTLKERMSQPMAYQHAVRCLISIAHALHFARYSAIIFDFILSGNLSRIS